MNVNVSAETVQLQHTVKQDVSDGRDMLNTGIGVVRCTLIFDTKVLRISFIRIIFIDLLLYQTNF
jgi:hypothetical protein